MDDPGKIKEREDLQTVRNKSAKIAKLLFKALNLKNEAMKMPYNKKYTKKINSSEKLSRKALELSRADIAAGVNNGFNDFISSAYNLGSLLFIQGRYGEAELLLAEVRSVPGFEGHMYSIPIDAYYGCILCNRAEYERSGEVLNKLMDDAEQNQYSAFIDTYALANAYGDAACAFTYADTGVGYPGDRFTEPLERLFELKQKGVAVNDNVIKKAAYFSASQQLYYMCCDSVTSCDSDGTVKTAEICLDFCKSAGIVDFYTFAAMRILAFAAARDMRFKDCAKICEQILELCADSGNTVPESPYGSVQDVAADINLLLGIIHYRVGHDAVAISHFEAAITALNANAKGKPLSQVGYVDVEAIIMYVSSAEKAAFAYEYIGASMHNQPSKYAFRDCLDMFEESIRYITSVSDEPYFYLNAASKYSNMSDWCEEAGDLQNAAKYSQLGEKHFNFAMANLRKTIDDRELYKKYCSRICTRKRFALRRGLLEEYADCLRCEMLLSDAPYTEPSVRKLAKLSYDMGNYCRATEKYQSALEHFDKVREYIYDSEGNLLEEFKKYYFPEQAMLERASVLVKLEEKGKAHESFEEFIALDTITSGGKLDIGERIRIARVARNIGLSLVVSAGYMHDAAVMSFELGDDHMRTAGLFNQEGICWYNASPERDDPDADCNCDECKSHCDQFEPMSERHARLSAMFAANELKSFENAYAELLKCDPNSPDVVDLMPSLLSNIAECHMRGDNIDQSMEYYVKSAEAFERLFASPAFNEKDEEVRKSDIFQYGICYKSMGEIYEKKDDNESSAKAFSKAIEIFAKIDSDGARYNLSYCLNARGCLNYRMGNYQNEVEDITRAIKLRSETENSEITVAIMLKNRAEAYEALGDYKSMHSDLSQSIDMLDKSQAPKEMLNSLYGEHLFALAICQEELDNDGNAADSYRKASQHFSAVGDDDFGNIDMQAVCHFRRANCLCRRDEHEYYGALAEYDSAVSLLEKLPPSSEKNERLSAVLTSRGGLYEAFRQLDLAREDYQRAESLKKPKIQNNFIQLSDKKSHNSQHKA